MSGGSRSILTNPRSDDLIADIHGCRQTLEALLRALGYAKPRGVYAHPARKAIFLGDFIDRGVFQREVVALGRPMMETGSALAVMGNYEFSAIAYHTRDSLSDGYLRKHSDKSRKQHQDFAWPYGSGRGMRDTGEGSWPDRARGMDTILERRHGAGPFVTAR